MQGLSRRVISDNGRSFVGASRSLFKEFDKFLKSALNVFADNCAAIHGFQLNFIPKYTSHIGGLWEGSCAPTISDKMEDASQTV